MPCWELFEKQSAAYRDSILAPHTLRVAIEAASSVGWDKYVGEKGIILGLDHFGASAPYETLYKEFGLTAEHVVKAVETQYRS